jgi:hypothetical protein
MASLKLANIPAKQCFDMIWSRSVRCTEQLCDADLTKRVSALYALSPVHTPFHIVKTYALCLIQAGGKIALTFSSCFIASPLCTPRYAFLCSHW